MSRHAFESGLTIALCVCVLAGVGGVLVYYLGVLAALLGGGLGLLAGWLWRLGVGG